AARAGELVRLADRPNGGIVLDDWHWFRGSPVPAMLDGIPPERITVVQLCDGHAQPVGSLMEATLDHRLLPGAGAWDLVGLLQQLRDLGVGAPISVEILSAELRRLRVDQAAAESFDAARSVVVKVT